MDVSVKTFKFLEIDTPASISVKDVCASVSVVQIMGYYGRLHSSATVIESVHWSTAKREKTTCHLDAILSRVHGSILCQQLLKIKSTKVPTSRAVEGSKPTEILSISHLFIFVFLQKRGEINLHISQFGIISCTRQRRRTRHSLDMLLRTPLALLSLLALSTLR